MAVYVYKYAYSKVKANRGVFKRGAKSQKYEFLFLSEIKVMDGVPFWSVNQGHR
jgi:hypothetical protein